MLSLTQFSTFRACRSVPLRIRTLATHATTLPSIPSTSESKNIAAVSQEITQKDGPLRPHLNIEVNPNHGLYAFFRRKEDKEKGVVSYETVEAPDVTTLYSGRSWSAAELRRKSFKDLHTLWYVLLRERNLLLTQEEEARRLRILAGLGSKHNLVKVRKSMARIKYVINERRLAYERAMEAYNQKRDAEMAAEQKQIEAGRREQAEKEEAEAKAKEAALRREAGEARTAARLAGAGLFETAQSSAASQGAGQAKDS